MRWEEIWDAALRIRNLFLTTPVPQPLYREIIDPLSLRFAEKAAVVRSSAPDEDSRTASFAGLHESFVNIRGPEVILDHVRLVWSSLWSDAALLYRQELGLDVSTSSMAVVVQEFIPGERSGVAFSRDPNNEARAVIEAVHGLNQGLVDGTIEPDRWHLVRKNGKILNHISVLRESHVTATQRGVVSRPLSLKQRQRAPLDNKEVMNVYHLLLDVEAYFGSAQDMEWTIKDTTLYLLQARPVTTTRNEENGDKRPWYRSLRRSYENLRQLRKKIEQEILPAMIEAAVEMAGKDLAGFTEQELKSEIIRRIEIYNYWVGVYWKDLIPFAHGIRLFGIAYNDALRPRDPYEFMNLLAATEMDGIERNRMLLKMAALARTDGNVAGDRKKTLSENKHFQDLLVRFIERFGDLSCATNLCSQGSDAIIDLVLELASVPENAERYRPQDINVLKKAFISHFHADDRMYAEELLDLARASYRTRDNDNIYLGKIKGQTIKAIDAYVRSFTKDGIIQDPHLRMAVDGITAPDTLPLKSPGKVMEEKGFRSQPRQLVGQPAGPGIARGKARVIADPSDLRFFKAGEVLVCDAVDPSITFIVPLASAIVERRGGMLIHGAIIAREYGLACVTGIPDATSLIHTGDIVTVDGYLGIVTIG